MRYEELAKAVKLLGLIRKTDKKTIKKNYFKLSKENHPDSGGDKEKFQEINNAYHLIIDYIDNYRYAFDEAEFKNQYPLSDWRY